LHRYSLSGPETTYRVPAACFQGLRCIGEDRQSKSVPTTGFPAPSPSMLWPSSGYRIPSEGFLQGRQSCTFSLHFEFDSLREYNLCSTAKCATGKAISQEAVVRSTQHAFCLTNNFPCCRYARLSIFDART